MWCKKTGDDGWFVSVARAGPVRAGQILRDGSQGEGASHADVPRLECSRQLRHTHQEEEDEAAASYSRRWTQPPSAADHAILITAPAYEAAVV